MEQIKKKLYPLKFRSTAGKTPWGGNWFIERLGKSYTEKVEVGQSSTGKKKYAEMPLTLSDKIGESWEIADIGFRDSEVAEGWLAGSTLSEALETYLEDVVGENVYSYYGRQFPLLVKLLDVQGRTSLMVCPDDEIASPRYDTLGKMKFWYIMDAEPGSRLYMGFRKDVPAKELYERCMNGSLEEVLNVVTPHRGDVFMIPAGLVHAAADGVSIVEISESSDLDFKIYDWKIIKDLSDTESISLEAAFDFINMGPYDSSLALSKKRKEMSKDGCTEKLVSRKEFTITEIRLKDAIHINTGTTDTFLIYVCVNGTASLQIHKDDSGIDHYEIGTGEVILVPADITDFFLVPQDRDTILLEATVEKIEEPDEYINPDVEAKLPGDDDDDKFTTEGGKKMSVEEFLRKNPGRMN